MAGLRNRSTWEPLPLKSSAIRSCAVGCSLAITARLIYANAGKRPVEGVFVYPLGEKEAVVGFQATVAGRLTGVRIRNRGRLQDREGAASSLDVRCADGRPVPDEDLERSSFVAGTGLIGPADLVSILVKTSLELPTLENGAIRIVYPALLTPVVAAGRSRGGGKSQDSGASSCFSATSGKEEEPALDLEQRHRAHAIFSGPVVAPAPYELNFQLLVRGACLLAGLESPTHALRADADPGARSARATYITLAQEHPYDRHVEIILHLSEPHSPLVVVERGRLSFAQYRQHILSRRDFARRARNDPDPERKAEFVRKRFHKDILNNPVLMLNFCPDFAGEPLELNKATREMVFLLDWSAGGGGNDFGRLKEALAVALKSLPGGSLLNVLGPGSPATPLFPASQLCGDVTLTQANEYVRGMRGHVRGLDLLAALSWLYGQPARRAYPRQIFIVADGSENNAARVLELVRGNASAGRCFGLGLGRRACRRLLQGAAELTGGTAHFVEGDQRLQPKLIKCVKKALEPALTDVRVDWYLPENMEALLSPNRIPPLYPGDRLVGYCALYDMSAFKARETERQERGYKGLGDDSTGSVFYPSNDDSSPPTSELTPAVTCPEENRLEEALREISREISSEFSCAKDADPDPSAGAEADRASDVRTRIQEASYIREQYVLTRCSLGSERSLDEHARAPDVDAAAGRARLPDTGSLPQGLEKIAAPDLQRSSLSRWAEPALRQNLSAEDGRKKEAHLRCADQSQRRQNRLARSSTAARSLSSPQGELEMGRLRRALEMVSLDQTLGAGMGDNDGGETKPPETASRAGLGHAGGLLFAASPPDPDHFPEAERPSAAAPPEEPGARRCRSLIHGLLGGRPVSWEVGVDLDRLLPPEDGRPAVRRDSWEELLHQLAARSLIRDFEKTAERENPTGRRSAKRYRVKAIQTSKHCNMVCVYTTFAVVAGNPDKGSRDGPELRRTGTLLASGRSRKRQNHCAGPMGRDCEEGHDGWKSADDTPTSPCSLTSRDSDSLSGGAASGSTGPSSARSQPSMESKSTESFFGTRFPLGRLRSSISSGRQVPLKSRCLSAETDKQSEKEAPDYLPLVGLQLASGAFLLTQAYAERVQISLERLKRASPYSLHRRSLSPPSLSAAPGPPRVAFSPPSPSSSSSSSSSSSPADTPRTLGRRRPSEPEGVALSPDPAGSEAGSPETGARRGSWAEPPDSWAEDDPEGSSWATAVALAWLEHRCAGYFMEWELVAAKADFWLRGRELPEGLDLAGLRGAARQLFLLLRHWDENIKFNMLCYNPDNM